MVFVIFQLDVIIADLDGGSVRVPEHVQLCFMPSYVRLRMVHSLNLVRFTVSN